MIFLVLGLLIGMLIILKLAQGSLDAIMPKVLIRTPINDSKFIRQFLVASLERMLAPSMKSSLAAATLMLLSKVRTFRYNILQLCLSPFSLVPLLIWSSFVFQISAVYMFGIAGTLLVVLNSVLKFSPHFLSKYGLFAFRGFLRYFFFLGLSLYLFEQLLRMGSQVLMSAHEYSWVFFLSQSPIENGLILFLLSALVSLILTPQGWSLVVALGFLSIGLLAFNNAIFIVAGELIVLPMTILFSVRKNHPSLRNILLQYTLAWALGVFCMMILFLTLKNQIFSSDVGSLTQIQLRFDAMIIVFIGLVLGGFLLTMIWGHFSSRRKMDDLAPTLLYGTEELAMTVNSSGELKFIESLVQARSHLLSNQARELQSGDYALISPALRIQHNSELQAMTSLLKILKSGTEFELSEDRSINL